MAKTNNVLKCSCGRTYVAPLELRTGEMCCPKCGKDIVPLFRVTAQSDEEFRLAETCYLTYLDEFTPRQAHLQLRERACVLYRKAALTGHPEALLQLAFCYDKGYLQYGGKINNQNVAKHLYRRIVEDYALAKRDRPEDYRAYVAGKGRNNPNFDDNMAKAYLDYAIKLSQKDIDLCKERFGASLYGVDGQLTGEVDLVIKNIQNKVFGIRMRAAFYICEMSRFLINASVLDSNTQELVTSILSDEAMKSVVEDVLNSEVAEFHLLNNNVAEDAVAFFRNVAELCLGKLIKAENGSEEKGSENDEKSVLDESKDVDEESNKPLFGFIRVSRRQAAAIRNICVENGFNTLYYSANGRNGEFKHFENIPDVTVSDGTEDDPSGIIYFYNPKCQRRIDGKLIKASKYNNYVRPIGGALSKQLNEKIYDLIPRELKPGTVFYLDDLYYLDGNLDKKHD